MATKIGDHLYRTSVYVGKDEKGKRKQEFFYGETADEADFYALEFKLKKKKCEDPLQITLREAISGYIASKDAVLSPTTIEGYRKIQRNSFQELMERPLSELDSKTLQAAINREAKTVSARGKPISPKTIANANGLVITVMNFYFPEKRIVVRLPQRKPVSYEPPDGEKLKRIFEITKGTRIEIPVLLAAWCSLRMSEICGLKWSDVHEDYIEINEAKVYAERIQHSKAPKTDSSARRILLPSYIKETLDRQERKGKYITDMKGQGIYKRFVTLLEKNGLPHYRFHDLRHSCASIMLQIGIPDQYAMKRGGWASDKVMKRVYQHTFSLEEINVANRIDDYFNNLIQQ